MKPFSSHRAIGDRGEAAVARFLKRRGYRILERNYTVKGGEIDLIARRFSSIVFVEVKTRRADTDSEKYGRAQDAVDEKKRGHLRYAASRYLSAHPTRLKPRFDVAEVYYTETPKPKFKVYYRKEAF